MNDERRPAQGAALTEQQGEHSAPWPDGDCRVCQWRTPWVPGWCFKHTRRMAELGLPVDQLRAA